MDGQESTWVTPENLHKQRGTAKSKVTRKLIMFKRCMDRDDPLEMWKEEYSEVNYFLKELENIHEKYINVLSDERQILEAEQYIADVECDVKICLSIIL